VFAGVNPEAGKWNVVLIGVDIGPRRWGQMGPSTLPIWNLGRYAKRRLLNEIEGRSHRRVPPDLKAVRRQFLHQKCSDRGPSRG
jgi:hypothetical protein